MKTNFDEMRAQLPSALLKKREVGKVLLKRRIRISPKKSPSPPPVENPFPAIKGESEERKLIYQTQLKLADRQMHVQVLLAGPRVIFRANKVGLSQSATETWIWRKKFDQLLLPDRSDPMKGLLNIVKMLNVEHGNLIFNHL
jgi:hypothetical protein